MPKILIVEDDPMILEIYQKKFSDSGFDVATASSGEEVLKIAKVDKIDVILLDLILPQMGGFEVIQNLRSGNYDTGIKIIISSNLSSQEDRDKALKLGANGFIAKSDYAPGDLVKEVQRMLGQYQEQKHNEEIAENGNGENESGKKKILLIEDEEIFIEMFGDKLKQEGYEVVSAQNGAWGVKEALKDDFDLFIVDMIMPEMTGEEMVGKFKLEDKTKNIPIIVMSASVDDESAGAVKAMGIQEFIVKTQITPGDLAKKVRELIGS